MGFPLNNYDQTQLIKPIEVLNNYFLSLYPLIINGILAFLVALIVFLIGWAIAWLFKEVVSFVLSKINLRGLLQKLNLDRYIENFAWEEKLHYLLGEVVFWFVLLIFLMSSLDILGLRIINAFIQDFLGYLPKAIAGGLILILGFVFGELVRKILVGVLRGLDRKSANGISTFIKWTIIVFAILAAFNQWGIAREIVNALAFGIVLFVALAGGLAFGLGGQDVAREFLENLRNKFK
jgi:hypothetical protein